MGAEYLSYVKSIASFALTFFGYIISVLASVICVSLLNCSSEKLCFVNQTRESADTIYVVLRRLIDNSLFINIFT